MFTTRKPQPKETSVYKTLSDTLFPPKAELTWYERILGRKEPEKSAIEKQIEKISKIKWTTDQYFIGFLIICVFYVAFLPRSMPSAPAVPADQSSWYISKSFGNLLNSPSEQNEKDKVARLVKSYNKLKHRKDKDALAMKMDILDEISRFEKQTSYPYWDEAPRDEKVNYEKKVSFFDVIADGLQGILAVDEENPNAVKDYVGSYFSADEDDGSYWSSLKNFIFPQFDRYDHSAGKYTKPKKVKAIRKKATDTAKPKRQSTNQREWFSKALKDIFPQDKNDNSPDEQHPLVSWVSSLFPPQDDNSEQYSRSEESKETTVDSNENAGMDILAKLLNQVLVNSDSSEQESSDKSQELQAIIDKYLSNQTTKETSEEDKLSKIRDFLSSILAGEQQ